MAKSAKIASFFDIPQSPELDTVHIKLARNQNRLDAVVRQDHISQHPFTALRLPPLHSHDTLSDTTRTETWERHGSVDGSIGSRRRSNTIKDKFRRVFGRSTEGRGPVQGSVKYQRTPQKDVLEPRTYPISSRSCPVTRPETPVRSRSSSFDEDDEDDLEGPGFNKYMFSASARQHSPKSKRSYRNAQVGPAESSLTTTYANSDGQSTKELPPVVEDKSPTQDAATQLDANTNGLLTPGCTLSREAPSDSSGTIRPTTSHSQKTWPKLSETEIRGRTGSEPVVSYTRNKGTISPVASLKTSRKGSGQTATRSAMEASSIAARLAQLEQRLGDLESKVRRLELNAQTSNQSKPSDHRRLPSNRTSPAYIVTAPSHDKPPSERSWLSQQSSQASLPTSLTSPTSSASHGEPDDDDASDDSPETPRTTFLLPPSSIPSRVDSRSTYERANQSNFLVSKTANTVTHIVEDDGPPHFSGSSRNGSADVQRLHSSSRSQPFVHHPGMAIASSTADAVHPGQRGHSNRTDRGKLQDDTHSVSYFPGSRFSAFDTDDEVDGSTRTSPQRAYNEDQLSPKAIAENPYEKSLSHSQSHNKTTTTSKKPDQWKWRSDEGLALAM